MSQVSLGNAAGFLNYIRRTNRHSLNVDSIGFLLRQYLVSHIRVCLLTEGPYSSNAHWARPINLPRPTPWTAGSDRPRPWRRECASGLAIDEAIRPPEIEAEAPIAKGLEPHAPEQSRVRARAAVINRDQRKQAPGDAPRLFRQNKGPKHRPIEITT